MMKYISLLWLLFLVSSCQKDNNFLIAKNQVGDLNNTTKISEIKTLLDSDSVVLINAKSPYNQSNRSNIKEVEVYDTSGQKQLLIKVNHSLDSVSLIENIRILTDKYKTRNGIGLGSTYAELKKHHHVSSIQTSLKSVILTLEDLNAFVSFDKKVLPSNVRFDLDANIKPTMIPDGAQINRFWINFKPDKDAK
ncbi:hypothetical protein [Flavobacterium sp. CS20]|uniref:hypothetical protein n=1 Tax=Flavobacterium sp. CS20 TaxID=2775246 RepID=UPI001B3A2062|nr:hypothetical protein [Flavobacterium sp. CS20]QTY27623.1 hypothetical protein IGB25_03530 [Flavobacterium sp. CS20]